jgi:hypothetical protein
MSVRESSYLYFAVSSDGLSLRELEDQLPVRADESWDRGSRNPAGTLPRRFSRLSFNPAADLGGDLQEQLADLLPRVTLLRDPLRLLTDGAPTAALQIVQLGPTRQRVAFSRAWIGFLADVGALIDIDQYLGFEEAEDHGFDEEIAVPTASAECLTISLRSMSGAASKVIAAPNPYADGLSEVLPTVLAARHETRREGRLASIQIRQDARSHADTGLGFGSAWLEFLRVEDCDLEISLGCID